MDMHTHFGNAPTYPNHCPTSCRTNNCHEDSSNYQWSQVISLLWFAHKQMFKVITVV